QPHTPEPHILLIGLPPLARYLECTTHASLLYQEIDPVVRKHACPPLYIHAL
ncbi:hypothetical protein PanWU01x14_217880, partial [Parasponia andersonii]